MLQTLALVTVGVPLLTGLAFSAAVAWWPYPDGLDRPPPSATLVQDRFGIALAAFAAPDGQWRFPLQDDEVSPHLRNALVAVEDARFFEHRGVDWQAAAAAAWQNAAALGVRRGASTLTMQLSRLRDPAPRTLWGKFTQAVRARQIEDRLDKQAIVTEYVNRAPFGGNLVGAGAASWRYFGKPCAQLSLGEAALLAGLPQNPNRLRPDRFPGRAARRRDHVLDRMLACGMISPADHADSKADPVRAAWRPLPQHRGGGAAPADGALPALVRRAGRSAGADGVVPTSIDATVQQQAYDAAREHLATLRAGGVSAAAVVVLDTATGTCLAAASLSPGGSAAVDLTRRPRSTGSVLKPFIYAAAFEAGACGPESILDDSPAAWPGYVPLDFDRQFRGQMTAGEALAESRNIPALVLLARTGVEHVAGVLGAAGLDSLARSGRDYGLSLAVGGAEATPMEVATAYAGMARGGITLTVPTDGPPAPPPLPLKEGRGEGGRDVVSASFGQGVPPLQAPRDPPPVQPASATGAAGGDDTRRFLSAAACWQVMHALSDPGRTATLSRAAAGLNVAWKTGTSSGHRDAWCAAVTPRRTVVVWLGNATGESSPALVGRDAAAPLALHLLAAVDPAPATWPNPLTASPAEGAAVRAAPRASMAIVSPAPGREVVLDDDLPADRQRVPLRVAGGPAEAVHWFVDGNHVGTSAPTSAVWWRPSGGTHKIRAVDASGRTATVSVTVRPR